MFIKSFPAHKGDAFALQGREGAADRYILIDAGTRPTYTHIKPYLNSHGLPLAIVVTHVDYDHVGGFLKMFADESLVGKEAVAVFINTPELILRPRTSDAVGIGHGLSFASLLKELKIEPRPLYRGLYAGDSVALSGLTLSLLSPPAEVVKTLMEQWKAQPLYEKLMAEGTPASKVSAFDPGKQSYAQIVAAKETIPRWQDDLDNSASIALIAADSRHKVLMLADSNPTLVCQALSAAGYSSTNKLKVNLVKLSHHGCRNNTSRGLLTMLDCKYFYISTNGVGNYYHPHRETIVRICEYSRSNRSEPIKFFTNYSLDPNAFITPQELTDWNISFTYKPELDLDECR
jgi:beta-lactamase superfamily II metal-dependent hydrolase